MTLFWYLKELESLCFVFVFSLVSRWLDEVQATSSVFPQASKMLFGVIPLVGMSIPSHQYRTQVQLLARSCSSRWPDTRDGIHINAA